MSDAMVKTSLSPLELKPSGPLRRDPPRPPALQQPGYVDRFDYFTVFYDCFVSADSQWIVLIGPPLFNLEKTVLAALHASLGAASGRKLPIKRRRQDRTARIRVPNIAGRIAIAPGLFRQDRLIAQPNLCSLFKGRKVLLTKSKNNELVWIRDWVRFFAEKHGCDAVLIYDNGSTRYHSDRVRETVSSVSGIEVGHVVDWPYRFGPHGGPARAWDSDFCQYAIMEHARHRFLALADVVVNADIDEFVLTKDGSPLCDLVRRSSTGFLHYQGCWIENATLAPGETRRHKDFFYQSTGPEKPINFKWTVMPSRCGESTQWKVHFIAGMEADEELSRLVSLRHFRAITDNWKGRRWKPERPNERDHVVDQELVSYLAMFEADPVAG